MSEAELANHVRELLHKYEERAEPEQAGKRLFAELLEKPMRRAAEPASEPQRGPEWAPAPGRRLVCWCGNPYCRKAGEYGYDEKTDSFKSGFIEAPE